MPSTVDLPQPEGPISDTTSPSLTEKFTSCTASRASKRRVTIAKLDARRAAHEGNVAAIISSMASAARASGEAGSVSVSPS
jgi:hypothetical protein